VKEMKILDERVLPPIAVAPMAGVTDYPYRQILRSMGAKFIYSEMVSSKGLVYNNNRTVKLLDYNTREDGYINIQLFGEDADFIVEAGKIVEDKYQPDFIDLNMGCPVPKVVKNGSGSALMQNPKKVAEIIDKMVKELKTPITVKIRAGWNQSYLNAVEIAQISEEKGAAAIAVHGRTREQFYFGDVDYEIIRKVKRAVDIPVIGNGDIIDIASATKMFEYTKCDGIMVGRGLRGNPWLIKRLVKYFGNDIILPQPKPPAKIDMAIKHLNSAIDYYGEKVAVPKMRQHISWYLKGLKNSTYIKDKINKSKDKETVIETLKKYKDTL